MGCPQHNTLRLCLQTTRDSLSLALVLTQDWLQLMSEAADRRLQEPLAPAFDLPRWAVFPPPNRARCHKEASQFRDPIWGLKQPV